MMTYTLTAFTKKGEKLMDESFEAEDDAQAKIKGTEQLKNAGHEEDTHRCVSSDGRFILFHR